MTGSAAKQYYVDGKIDAGESITRGLTNAVGQLPYNIKGIDKLAESLRPKKNVADVQTGIGYDASDTPVRIVGDWTENDMKQALLGHPPRGLGSPDIHHGGQMPRGALHEVL